MSSELVQLMQIVVGVAMMQFQQFSSQTLLGDSSVPSDHPVMMQYAYTFHTCFPLHCVYNASRLNASRSVLQSAIVAASLHRDDIPSHTYHLLPISLVV